MHPGFHHWRRRRMAEACRQAYVYAGGASERAEAWRERVDAYYAGEWTGDPVFGSAGLGVRRPLRFLAMRLRLDDAQIGQAARILERLKLEREQASIDSRRAASETADALESAELAQASLDAVAERRLAAARRVQDALSEAMRELHRVLSQEQRQTLARLIRTGVVRL